MQIPGSATPTATVLRNTVARLRNGQQWLTERHEEINRLNAELAKEMDRWVDMELESRHKGFKGCIHGDAGPCTQEVVIRCLHCSNVTKAEQQAAMEL